MKIIYSITLALLISMSIDIKLTEASVRVYLCDFNGNTDCGGTLSGMGVGHVFFIVQQIGITTPIIYGITDVSSITTPTSNGLLCQIPFLFAGNQLYHCTSFTFKCITTNTSEADCYRGYFLSGYSSLAGASMFGLFKFPNISLPLEGDYLIRFYVFLFCDTSNGCHDSDHVNVEVVYGDTDDEKLNLYYDYNNIGPLRQWVQMETLITIKNLSIFTINVSGGRLVDANSQFFFGFDNLEIFYLNESTTLDITDSTILFTTTEIPDTTTDQPITIFSASTEDVISTFTDQEIKSTSPSGIISTISTASITTSTTSIFTTSSSTSTSIISTSTIPTFTTSTSITSNPTSRITTNISNTISSTASNTITELGTKSTELTIKPTTKLTIESTTESISRSTTKLIKNPEKKNSNIVVLVSVIASVIVILVIVTLVLIYMKLNNLWIFNKTINQIKPISQTEDTNF